MRVRITLLFRLFRLCVLLCASTAAATTYYVSPGGNNSNSGSIDNPWRSLQRASSGLSAGDTVYVRAGTYHERFQPDNAGSPNNPIVYKAYPGEYVEIDGTSADGNLTVMVIYPSNIVIEGFTVTNQNYFRTLNDNTYWVQLEGNGLTFRNNRVYETGDVFDNIYNKNATSRGIVVAGKNILVESCFVRGLVFGIVIAGSAPRYAIIRNDTVYAVGQNCIDVTSTNDGVSAYHGTLIEGCRLDTSFIEDNIQFEPDYNRRGSTLYNRGTIIRNNYMGHAAENAIDLKGAGHTIIEHNYLYSSSGDDDGPIGGHDATSGAGIETSPTDPTRFTIVRYNVVWDHCTGMTLAEGDHYYNNTIMNNRRTWQGPDQTDDGHTCVRVWNLVNQPRAFKNNIVAGMPTGSMFYCRMDWGGNFTLDYNLYYESNGGAIFMHRIDNAMVTTVGLTAWQTWLSTYNGYAYMAGKDAHSIEADPRLVNVPLYPNDFDSTWNFGLLPGSPAIDAGAPVATAQQGSTGSVILTVDDAYYFCDGFGITDGDLIKIGASTPVRIASIDYDSNTVTLADARSWSAGEGVHLAFQGAAPDLGAIETNTVSIPSPSAPVLSSPANGATGLSTTVTLTWLAGNSSTTHRVQIAGSASFASLQFDSAGITGNAIVVTNLNQGTSYFWRVNASNGIGTSDWSPARRFSVALVDNPPSIPTLVGPTNGTTGLTTNPLISWTAVPQAVTYHLVVASDSAFTLVAQDFPGLTTTSLVVNGLSTGTTYYWHVNAKGATATSGWSAMASLTTFALPATFAGNGVENPTFDNGTSDWGFYTNGAGIFNIGGPGFFKSSCAKISITQTGSNTQLYQSYILLHPDSLYRLQFAAYSSTGNDCDVSVMKSTPPFTPYGLLSQRFDLTTGWKLFYVDFKPDNISAPVNDALLRISFSSYAAQGDMYSIDAVKLYPVSPSTPPPVEPAADYSLDENFPNPFNPATTIRYSIPVAAHVVIKVYNLLGQLVTTPVDGAQIAGVHQVTLDMRRYASGMYLYVFQAGTYQQTRKLLYIK